MLAEIVASDERVLDDPAPTIKVNSLGESSVDFIVRPWVRTENYWDVYWDTTREVKIRSDAEGINDPRIHSVKYTSAAPNGRTIKEHQHLDAARLDPL